MEKKEASGKNEGGLIKLWYKHGILYKSKSIGENGKEFDALKLRTMWPNMPIDQASTKGAKDDTQDNRIAGQVAHFVRRKRIDELPQIRNILRGEMGIVGNRPMVPEYFYGMTAREQKKYLEEKPGLLITNFGLRHSIKNEHKQKYIFSRWRDIQEKKGKIERMQNYFWVLLCSFSKKEIYRKKDIRKIKESLKKWKEEVFSGKNLKDEKIS